MTTKTKKEKIQTLQKELIKQSLVEVKLWTFKLK